VLLKAGFHFIYDQEQNQSGDVSLQKRFSRKYVSDTNGFKWVHFDIQKKKITALNDPSQENITFQPGIAISLLTSTNLTT